jgi:hypothetical protein
MAIVALSLWLLGRALRLLLAHEAQHSPLALSLTGVP